MTELMKTRGRGSVNVVPEIPELLTCQLSRWQAPLVVEQLAVLYCDDPGPNRSAERCPMA